MMPIYPRTIYRWFTSLLGRHKLQRMLVEGLPKSFQQPLHFLLTEKISQEDQLVVNRIEAIRSAIASRGDEKIPFYTSPGASSPAILRTQPIALGPIQLTTVSLHWIAHTASISQYWGTFLYLIANAYQARTILELRSCAGISGCYLAASRYCNRFITIEGSRPLAALANLSLSKVAKHPLIVHALFDEGRDMVLPPLDKGLDLVHIDGHDEKNPTLHYFQRLVPHLNKGCLLVFDDIHWTPDMCEAWETLRHWHGLAFSINLGRCGLCVWDSVTTHVKTWDFSAFAAFWKKGRFPAEAN